MPGEPDCGCCEDGGYVVDGICVACGWGDVDHKTLGDHLHAALSLLAEARAVLDQAIWRLEIVSQEVDSTFCRDALTGLRGLRATLDAAATREEVT